MVVPLGSGACFYQAQWGNCSGDIGRRESVNGYNQRVAQAGDFGWRVGIAAGNRKDWLGNTVQFNLNVAGFR